MDLFWGMLQNVSEQLSSTKALEPPLVIYGELAASEHRIIHLGLSQNFSKN